MVTGFGVRKSPVLGSWLGLSTRKESAPRLELRVKLAEVTRHCGDLQQKGAD